VAATRPPALPSCAADTDAAFAGAWSDARRASVGEAFAKTGKPYADRAFATASAGLDRATAAWKSSRTAACRATRVERVQSEEDMLLRMTCLERQRAELAALVDLLVAADAKVVELAVQGVAALPRPGECDDVRVLAVAVKPPADPALRTEIDKLRIELASASALPNIGRPRDAIARYLPIAARAKEIGYRPLEAEALYVLGFAQSANGEYREAGTSLEAAVLAAEAGRMDRLAVRACVRLTSIAGQSSRTVDANNWANRAAAIIERIGGDRLLEADLAFARGNVALAAGRYADAIPEYQRVLATREQLLGPDHTDTLLVHVNLGAAYDELARPDEAIAQSSRAIAAFDRTLGPEHPRGIIVISNLALVQIRVGQLAEAERLLVKDLEVALAAHGSRSRRTAIVHIQLSKLRLAQGRAEDALGHAHAAANGLRETTGETSDIFGEAVVLEGAALLGLGKPAEAVATLRRGIAIRDAVNRESLALAENLTTLAAAELAVGKPTEAVPVIERALKLSEHPRYAIELARTRLVAARAYAAVGDRDRARQLVTAARQSLGTSPAHASLLAEIDAVARPLE
jgi:tetratricopeptide (TPR) repeat protein